MDVNHYCCTSHGEYVICECTLLTFNFMDGIKDVYHEIINPGRQWQMLSMVRTRSPLVRLIALSAHAEVAAGQALSYYSMTQTTFENVRLHRGHPIGLPLGELLVCVNIGRVSSGVIVLAETSPDGTNNV
ncbi:hypothetical protein EVAR_102318_1 [Eumeta japonica]|uniref:Maelstrom domain-containing protein n=1 Tax=Eumeta variegata TaxID=151549 RepID=A0A4C2ADP5_EUMVA|nr:hypothetical protein EVAR_102318_1 [Eumeta japonica]